MRLLIEGASAWVTHKESGARFHLRAIGGADYEQLREGASGPDGKFNYVLFCERVAVAGILDWERVGDTVSALPASEPNKASFGRHHAITVMPWLTEQVRSLDRFLADEVDAAKNG